MAGICSESREKSTCRCWSVVTAGVVGAARGVAAQAKWEVLVAHLVRDEGVVGSNPITPTKT